MKNSGKAVSSKIKIDYSGVKDVPSAPKKKAKPAETPVEEPDENASVSSVKTKEQEEAPNEAVLKRLEYIQQMIQKMQDSLD